MALTGYPQTHNSPDLEVVTTENDTTQYKGPFSSIKVLGTLNTNWAELYIYLSAEGYDKATGDQVAGTDYHVVRALATDTLSGPIYGFRMHSNSSNDAHVIGYRYSTDIL